MNYQRKNLSDGSSIGAEGPLPRELWGLGEDILSDLSGHLDPKACEELGYVGQGFFLIAPPPQEPEPEVRRISRIAFMQRIPGEKRIAIRTAAKSDPILEDFLAMLEAASLIELDHADTSAGVQYLVAGGHLTTEEATALLA